MRSKFAYISYNEDISQLLKGYLAEVFFHQELRTDMRDLYAISLPAGLFSYEFFGLKFACSIFQ